MLATISYPPIPIFELGPLHLSLHGLMAGVGFVVGAWLMLREAKKRGFDREKITSVLTWGLVGSIIGARAFTIPAHLDEGLLNALEPFSYFSIMGGFAGGIIVGAWRMRMLGLNVLTHMDLAAPGLAIGTVVGRIGDLLIVEHLGGRTDFFLGFVTKPGYELAPQHGSLQRVCETDGICGPYHFSALYDLIGAAVLLGVLYLVARNWSRLRYGIATPISRAPTPRWDRSPGTSGPASRSGCWPSSPWHGSPSAPKRQSSRPNRTRRTALNPYPWGDGGRHRSD